MDKEESMKLEDAVTVISHIRNEGCAPLLRSYNLGNKVRGKSVAAEFLLFFNLHDKNKQLPT